MTMSRKETNRFITTMRQGLSAKAKAVLQNMKDAEDREEYEDAEIIKDGRHRAMLGLDFVSAGIIDELLCALFLHAEEETGAKMQRYTLNSDARRYLETGDITLDL